MARIIPGTLGPFRGKIGDVEVYKDGDKQRARSARCPTTIPPTEGKESQQLRFTLVGNFFNKVIKTINMGYRANSKVKGIGAAISDHMNSATIGTFPNFELDYSQLHVTRSDNGFHGGFQVSLYSHPDSKVTLNWNALTKLREQYPGVAGPEDLVHVTIFNVTKQRAIEYFSLAERGAKTVTCELPYGMEGDVFHAYLYFTSDDGKYVSDSDYAGSFTLLE